MEILLNNAKGGDNVNVDNSVYFELSAQQSLLPANGISSTINQYEIYLDERNNTKKYKLFFNIAPYMSNILFNTFTEIIGEVGKTTQFMLSDKNFKKTGTWSYNAMRKPEKGLTRYEAIKDTEYSHPLIGNFEYQCGIDIFNNHYLRSNGYFHIQKCHKTNTSDDFLNEKVINTIEDLLSYNNGIVAEHKREIPGAEGATARTETRNSHLFNHDNLTSMFNAFVDNLKEENGWFGFINKSYANDLNHTVVDGGNEKSITVNKCINNKGACEFVDMYPTRKEFSFIPFVNENYNNRLEYNWDWCITYPFEKVDTGFTFFKKQGLYVGYISRDKFAVKNNLDNRCITRDRSFVYFRTIAKHGLKLNDDIKLSYGDDSFLLKVLAIGNEMGEQKDYYFAVAYDDLADEWGEKTTRINYNDIRYIKVPDSLYVAKIVNGIPCEYYIRKFKEIGKLKSSISKAGFSKTIYNDSIAQIIYSDDINIEGIKNHMGFELDEIFLTIIKKNVGYKEWYEYGATHPTFIEQSHCFGNVSSGFNFEHTKGEEVEYIRDNNIRYYHECDENVVQINHTKMKDNFNDYYSPYRVFMGDFVEFSPSTLTETILETVHHRFNTAQREMILNNTNDGFPCDFNTLKFDELVYDDNDFDFSEGTVSAATSDNTPFFKVEKRNLISNYANISPEGYFYKPHYRIKLKEYSNKVNVMSDLLIEIEEKSLKTTEYLFEYSITTKINYGIRVNDILVIYDTNGRYYEVVVSPKTNGNNIILLCDKTPNNLLISKVFVKNKLAPEYSYYISDGSGRRIWKTPILDSELSQTSEIYNRTFANGSFYINTNINFFLRRQDPDGIYGLQNWGAPKEDGDLKTKNDFVLMGLKQEFLDVEYKINNDYNACEV